MLGHLCIQPAQPRALRALAQILLHASVQDGKMWGVCIPCCLGTPHQGQIGMGMRPGLRRPHRAHKFKACLSATCTSKTASPSVPMSPHTHPECTFLSQPRVSSALSPSKTPTAK